MHRSANFKPPDLSTIGLYIFFEKKISKVNLSPHKNLLFKKNNDLHLCKKKNATLQHSETANYARKPLVQTLKKKSESESELTDFDILKSVIGITDIRVIG